MNNNPSWTDTLININASIREAIQVLNRVGLRIVIIVNESGKFIGAVSDGDIRRGILKGYTLESSIEKILNADAIVVPEGLPQDVIKRMMLVNKIQQIPIVNNENKVIGLHLWDQINLKQLKPNLFVIMAGGKGTRLLPYTEECPKTLVKVGDKPMIEHIINRAKYFGYKNFLISIYHFGDKIQDYLGDGNELKINLEYLREESPLGTAGALSLISNVPDLPLIITNGDVMSEIDFEEILDFHNRNNAIGTMAVKIFEWQNPYGVVKIDGIDIVSFEEKPTINTHINAGVYVLSPIALKYLEAGKSCTMPDLFEKLRLNSKKIIAYPMHEPWFDVGRPSDLKKANDEILMNKGLKKYE